MFKAISKIVNPTMPDGKEIAQKVINIRNFEKLTGVSYVGEYHIPTMDDLYYEIMRSQSRMVFRKKESEKVKLCVHVFDMIDAFIDCIEMNKMNANKLFSIMSSLENLADYTAVYGKPEQKEKVVKVYDRVLDADIQYHDRTTNIRWLMDVINHLKNTNNAKN